MEVIEISSDSDSDSTSQKTRAPPNKRRNVVLEKQAVKMTYREAHEKRKRTKEHYREKRTRQASQAVALPFPLADTPEALLSLPGSPAGAVVAGEKMGMPFRMFETQSSSPSSDSAATAAAVSALQPTAANRTRHPKMEDRQEPFPQSLPFPPPCGDAFLAALVAELQPRTTPLPGSEAAFVSPPVLAAAKQNKSPPFLLAATRGKTAKATAAGRSKVMSAKPGDPCQTTNVSASSDVISAAATAAAATRHEESPRTIAHRHQRASITASRRHLPPGLEMRRATPLGAVMQHWERLWREPSDLCRYWLGRPLFRRRRTEADDRPPPA
ncbi:hypothetical protein NQ176_g9726 [Zarea fungicola]|uniref:Uncharacterized protein n=1 Tax=Zarea fungicola TaxID=93591 RepID=A0ACC1ML02_9HYPO|nr:hypothetical protein NQ176_g9726 [Lecanicillium fungicola]